MATHKVFLTAVAADSVARQKLSGCTGHAAFLACGWCLFQGQRELGTMGFKGYEQPVKHDMVVEGHFKVGEPLLKLTRTAQIHRAREVCFLISQSFQAAASFFECR